MNNKLMVRWSRTSSWRKIKD